MTDTRFPAPDTDIRFPGGGVDNYFDNGGRFIDGVDLRFTEPGLGTGGETASPFAFTFFGIPFTYGDEPFTYGEV
jgi:hypothetical protein